MEEKFDTEFCRSQDEVCQFRWEVEEKFDASVAEVNQDWPENRQKDWELYVPV